MFTSSADVFRTRQVVADLLDVVRLHRNAVLRIGVSGAESASIEAILDQGGQIPEARRKVYSSILFAAAMPDDDFNSFVAATALLLADRLQGGAGNDNLYWNFDAFRDHFLIADAPVRAALMNGFRALHMTGQVSLPGPIDPATCFTRQEEDVYLILKSEQAESLSDILLAHPDANEAGALWEAQMGQSSRIAIRASFRYLFERPESIAPQAPEAALLIPWG
ncbi:MAG: hypothetical protein AAF222_09820 [Pseudomonadota bacterium]